MEYDILTEWFKYLTSDPTIHVNLFGILISCILFLKVFLRFFYFRLRL